MWNRVIRDYFAAFRVGNLKEKIQFSNWWTFIYFLFLFPIIMQYLDTPGDIVRHFCIMIPLMYSVFVLTLHPAVMPKILYLCPMSKAARKEYMEKSRWMRIVVSSGVSLLGVIGLWIQGATPWLYGLAVLINLILFHIVFASIVNKNGYGTLDANGRRVMDMESKQGFMEGCMMLVTMITAIVQVAFPWGELLWWQGLLWIGIPTVIELPIVIWFLRHWPQMVERALQYETAVKL